jgi:hypothetical protein
MKPCWDSDASGILSRDTELAGATKRLAFVCVRFFINPESTID